ncbi:hypothetical protein [Clostridium porci]|uniref:hypothetical protein n=1 Tax=Clostridium porci TaxID=2605778 RepID=UPI0012B3993E|nr:hypothetical protein [Clostridium porci]
MDDNYISGGTLQVCPHSHELVIVTFFDHPEVFDLSQCPYHSECSESTCPLCNYLRE